MSVVIVWLIILGLYVFARKDAENIGTMLDFSSPIWTLLCALGLAILVDVAKRMVGL